MRFFGPRKMPNGQKSSKNGVFRTFRGQKIAKNQKIKNLVGHFLQTIPKSKCTEFQPIWTALPEVIRTFMRFLGAKNPHRKYKGFRPMVKTLPYVLSHNFWLGRFQTKYDHFLKTRKIDLKHITRRKKSWDPPMAF